MSLYSVQMISFVPALLREPSPLSLGCVLVHVVLLLVDYVELMRLAEATKEGNQKERPQSIALLVFGLRSLLTSLHLDLNFLAIAQDGQRNGMIARKL